jgi:gas vesicle protein
MNRRWFCWCVAGGVVGVAAGCSGRPQADQSRLDAIVQEKVSLMRRLADEVAKNPNSVDVAGLVEEFVNTPFDPQTHPAEAAEILKTYNERVKGKVRGDAAAQLQSAMSRVQPEAKGK